MKVFSLSRSDSEKFQWKIESNEKIIYFGDHDMKDYTMSKNIEAKLHYIKATENFWDNEDMTTEGFWTRWLLYNKTNIEKSIEDVEKRFKIKIFYDRNILDKIKKSCVGTIRKTNQRITKPLLAF